jgi:hypothetical protein
VKFDCKAKEDELLRKLEQFLADFQGKEAEARQRKGGKETKS